MKLSKAIKKFDASITVEATRRLYHYAMASLMDGLGDMRLKAITIDDLQQWENRLDKTKSASTRNRGKKLSDYTQHKMVRQVKHFFNWCVK